MKSTKNEAKEGDEVCLKQWPHLMCKWTKRGAMWVNRSHTEDGILQTPLLCMRPWDTAAHLMTRNVGSNEFKMCWFLELCYLSSAEWQDFETNLNIL